MGLGSFLKSLLGTAEREVKTEINRAERSVEQGIRSSVRQSMQPNQQQTVLRGVGGRPVGQRTAPQPEPEPYDVMTLPEAVVYFREILTTEFGQYPIREQVPVQELAGNVSDEFKLYKTLPQKAYKAEWGKPYDFVMYEGGRPKAVVMLGVGQDHYNKSKFLISRMFAKKLGLPYISFYIQFPNRRAYVIERIRKNLI